MAELHKPRLFAQLENLREQSRKRLQVPLAEVGDGVEIGRISPTMLRKSTRSRVAVAIGAKNKPHCNSREQQPRHHRRVKRRLPALARIRGFDLTKVEMLEHKRQNEASQVVRADKVLHARRQQQRLIVSPGPEGLLISKQNRIRANAATKTAISRTGS